jgi:hypothetical protein
VALAVVLKIIPLVAHLIKEILVALQVMEMLEEKHFQVGLLPKAQAVAQVEQAVTELAQELVELAVLERMIGHLGYQRQV